MNIEQVRLGGQSFNFVITHKPIRRFYFRFKENTFYISAPFYTKKSDIDALFTKNEQQLLALAHRKGFAIDVTKPLKVLEKEYHISLSTINSIQDSEIFVTSLVNYDILFTILSPLLMNYVAQRLPYFHHLMYPKQKLPTLSYKRVKGYYGKYQASKHHITLNLNLVFLDEKLVDYVIVHELSHISHLNHQKKFYQSLESIMPDYRLLQKRLKKEGVIL